MEVMAKSPDVRSLRIGEFNGVEGMDTGHHVASCSRKCRLKVFSIAGALISGQSDKCDLFAAYIRLAVAISISAKIISTSVDFILV
jgi:hypothetical protein